MGSWAVRMATDGLGHQQLNRPSLLSLGGMHKNPLRAAPCLAQQFPGQGEREKEFGDRKSTFLGKTTSRVLFSDRLVGSPRLPQAKGFGGRRTGGSQTSLSLQSRFFFLLIQPLFCTFATKTCVRGLDCSFSPKELQMHPENVRGLKKL